MQFVNCIAFMCFQYALSDVQDDSLSSHMTDWEKEREREEFAKAAHLFQPLSNMMASRFTRAKHDDDEQVVNLPAEVSFIFYDFVHRLQVSCITEDIKLNETILNFTIFV